ncbi:DNA topoisomerase IB [Rufibacter quisquiliarum]|uniref:DNA topoisomerase n=1 Tax=Rufibacter quisquiliarum TaxID=1549639 RepID=A0A839GPJ0_9BACT|nr:DNA topoisomerase IB [Rufibacter quisquiliarum]MBA9078709.1 DNA topoisomerase-1 [Rufibacter quisquiliarum]
MEQELSPAAVYADVAASAQQAGLRYYPDTKPGITRRSNGKKVAYFTPKGEPVEDGKTLDRINRLVIPPAWTEVWICPSANGHIQATGRDDKGRKQYLYHAQWKEVRSLNKFGRMIAFGKALPEIRKQVEKDLKRKKLEKRKILAIVVELLDNSFIRIGNKAYAKENKSYGLTTLRDRHVKIEGSNLKLEFVGKKGIQHEITIKDRRLAKLVKQCQDIPGYDLFQYYDEDGNRQPIESGDVNDYLRSLSAEEFTAKDFRTWGGTVMMVECLEQLIDENPEIEKEKSVKEAAKMVAHELGNTPTVCSKYYIHPEVVNLFKQDKLIDYLRRHDAKKRKENPFLSRTEAFVIKMLQEVKGAV